MPESALDMFGPELDFLEDMRVRVKSNQRAIRFTDLALLFLPKLSLLARGFDVLPLTEAFDKKFFREGVHGFGPDSVQSDAKLKDIVVVFRARVDLGNAIDD